MEWYFSSDSFFSISSSMEAYSISYSMLISSIRLVQRSSHVCHTRGFSYFFWRILFSSHWHSGSSHLTVSRSGYQGFVWRSSLTSGSIFIPLDILSRIRSSSCSLSISHSDSQEILASSVTFSVQCSGWCGGMGGEEFKVLFERRKLPIWTPFAYLYLGLLNCWIHSIARKISSENSFICSI